MTPLDFCLWLKGFTSTPRFADGAYAYIKRRLEEVDLAFPIPPDDDSGYPPGAVFVGGVSDFPRRSSTPSGPTVQILPN